MKGTLINIFKHLGLSVGSFNQEKYNDRISYLKNKEIFEKYKDYTMIPNIFYIDNLELSSLVKNIEGDVVECGVWRGGMVAGIAEILGKERTYRLFDSFEGLPEAKEIDGKSAVNWQKNKEGRFYYDNCAAEEKYAREAMNLSGASKIEIVKGWFNETVFKNSVQKIALLRLDGDWYESTMTCLEAFYPKIVTNGVIIIDDYYQWDGCSRAVHDYLSKNGITDRIYQSKQGVAYIIKNKLIREPI